jgi:hypothetical protein
MKIKGLKAIASTFTSSSSSLTFAICFATVFLGFVLSTNLSPLINDYLDTNSALAQQTVADLATSTSDNSNSSNTMIFNKYENSEMGISIKYPSNFLIDESNSNETVKQVSFFPAYDDSDDYPPTYISWFNVYVEDLYPPISDNPVNISTYLKDEANSIQEENADVTILETSTDYLLSGQKAYKLVTMSYSGNSTVNDVEVGTIVGNKLYILNYEVNSQDFKNALPIANRMIYSFEITSNNFDDSIKQIVNSTSLNTLEQKVPALQDLLSSFSLKNLTENPYGLLSKLGLDNSTKNTVEELITNATQSMNGTSPVSHLPLNFSSLLHNGLSLLDPQKLCSNEMMSSLCQGLLFSHAPMSPFSTNGSSFGGLSSLFSMAGDNSTKNGFNLSGLKNLLGPFAMLAAPGESMPGLSSSSPSFFSNASNLDSLFGNTSDSESQFLDQLFAGSRSLPNNSTVDSNKSGVNPFESLFSSNESGLGMFDKSTNSSMNPISQDNGTVDILRMLEFFQGGH